MEFVVLQARSENRKGIAQAVKRVKSPGGVGNTVYYHQDIVGTQLEAMRLNGAGSNVSVIAGLGIDERFPWTDLAAVMKRIAPHSFFLVFSQIPLKDMELTSAMDAVIPRERLEQTGSEFDIVAKLLTRRYPKRCTLQQMLHIVPELIPTTNLTRNRR